jgi:hypothetical protein
MAIPFLLNCLALLLQYVVYPWVRRVSKETVKARPGCADIPDEKLRRCVNMKSSREQFIEELFCAIRL